MAEAAAAANQIAQFTGGVDKTRDHLNEIVDAVNRHETTLNGQGGGKWQGVLTTFDSVLRGVPVKYEIPALLLEIEPEE